MTTKAKRLAEQGIALLEEAVLEILADTSDEERIGPTRISHRLGIEIKATYNDRSDPNIVLAILQRLDRANKVERIPKPGTSGRGWRLASTKAD